MDPTDDGFWTSIEKMTSDEEGGVYRKKEDGGFKCNFCGKDFAPMTSITRLKWHLSGIEGHGTKICEKATAKIQQAVSGAMQQPSNKKRRSSSNMIDEVGNFREEDLERMQVEQGVEGEGRASSHTQAAGDHMENTSTPEGNQQAIHTSFWPERLAIDALETREEDQERMQLEQGVQGEGRASSYTKTAGDNMENASTSGGTLPIHISFWPEVLSIDALEPKGEDLERMQWEEGAPSHTQAAGVLMENISTPGGTQPIGTSFWPQWLAFDVPEPRGVDLNMERTNWHDIARISEIDVQNGTGGLMQPTVAGDSSSGGLPRNTSDPTRGDPLPSSTVKLVGKAFEANVDLIWSWLRKDNVSLIGIYGMAGVGKTSLVKLIYDQLKKISNPCRYVCWVSISKDFSIYELQKRIAKRLDLDLSSEDEEMHRASIISDALDKNSRIIILDDLWNSFDLEKVGITIQEKRCRLIFTTRSLTVCKEMGCRHLIKVMPLSQEEDWILFKEKLLHDVALSPEVEGIARSITKECARLPLAIITLARSMRGVDDLHEWRNTLRELRLSKVKSMEDKVFHILRLSYNRLDDSKTKQCLLYCALYPEDYEIVRIELICHLIDEGIIERMESRQAEYDEGHTMLNKLENVSLLERCRSSIDDRLAVKMHDLLRELAVQILHQSSQVMVEAGSTLIELPDLKNWKEDLVRVTLMQNQIEEVPSSLSPECPKLSTLLLQTNKKLRFIADSFFNHLPELKILDMSATAIEILPNSICDLVTLEALVLKGCWKLRHVPSLEKLQALKRLDLGGTALENMPRGMECLSDLRYLRLNGCGQKEFPAGILPGLARLQVFILEEQWPPMGYVPASVQGKELACLRTLEELQCHFEHSSYLADYLLYSQINQTRSPCEYCFFVGQFDQDVVDIISKRCWKRRTVGLSGFSICRDSIFEIDDIEELWICKCHDARSLCEISSVKKYATELEVIGIWDCNSMKSLVSPSWFYDTPLELGSSLFSRLERFHCYRCTSMKEPFPHALLPNLRNLVHIKVEDCPNMEEIIATGDEEVCMIAESNSSSFNLPKLQILELRKLPQLKSICRAKLRCNFIQQIVVWDCTKLKRMPSSFSSVFGWPLFHFLEEISVYPKEWWESELVWDNPRTKEALLPFVTFAWYPLQTSFH